VHGKQLRLNSPARSSFCPSRFSFDQSRSRTHKTGIFLPRFLAYGIGLDPHQAELFGAKYGPVLVGLTVGLM